MRDTSFVDKLRDAAARVGYYDERGDWVNAEWMGDAANRLDELERIADNFTDYMSRVKRADRGVLESFAHRMREALTGKPDTASEEQRQGRPQPIDGSPR